MNTEKFVSLFRSHLNVILSDVSGEEKENALNSIRDSVNNEYALKGASSDELAEVYFLLGDSLQPMRGIGGFYYFPLFFEDAYKLYRKVDDYQKSLKCVFWIVNGYHQQTDNFCRYSMYERAKCTAEKAMYYFKDMLSYAESKECGKKQLYCEVMTIDGCSMLRSLGHDLFNSHLEDFLVDYSPVDKDTAQELYYYLGNSVERMLMKEEIQKNPILFAKYKDYYGKVSSLLKSLK